MSEKVEEKAGEKEKTGEKEQPQAAEKKEAPYQVIGRDFSIIEGDLIEFYKARMKIMAVKFKLVGQVNSKGQYVISELVRRDLVRMEKEIEDQGENYYKAIALYMKKYFYFTVKIEMQGNNTAKATLFLREFVDGFLGEDYIVTPVAEFVANYDEEFRIKLRKVFHLVDVEVKNDDMAIPELAVIMQDAFDMDALLGGLFDMASQIYLMKMLKALEEKGGEKGNLILNRYRQLLAGRNNDINDKHKYITFKAMLDRAIDEHGGLERLGLDKMFLKGVIKDYNKLTNLIDKARVGVFETDSRMLNKGKEESKSGKAKVAGSKSSSIKPSSAKSAPKPAKKKEVKKAAAATEQKKPGGPSVDLITPPEIKIDTKAEFNFNTPSLDAGEFKVTDVPRERDILNMDAGGKSSKSEDKQNDKTPQEKASEGEDEFFDIRSIDGDEGIEDFQSLDSKEPIFSLEPENER